MAVAWAATALVAYLLKGTFGNGAWQSIGPSLYALRAEDVLFFVVRASVFARSVRPVPPEVGRVTQITLGLWDSLGQRPGTSCAGANCGVLPLSPIAPASDLIASF
jgi:hypothetical protein